MWRASSHAPTKINIVFLISKQEYKKAQQPFNPRPTLYPIHNSKDINSKTKYKKKTILISYEEPILKQKPIFLKNCH